MKSNTLIQNNEIKIGVIHNLEREVIQKIDMSDQLLHTRGVEAVTPLLIRIRQISFKIEAN